jgi:hypothetical protein
MLSAGFPKINNFRSIRFSLVALPSFVDFDIVVGNDQQKDERSEDIDGQGELVIGNHLEI